MDKMKEKAYRRLYELLEVQEILSSSYGSDNYNVFIFGSYLTIKYKEGISDIDIAIYSKDFGLYKKIALFLEEYFGKKGIRSDIFFIDISLPVPIYLTPLKSKVCFTDYYPDELKEFQIQCEESLEELRLELA